VVKHLLSSSPLMRVPPEHGEQEIRQHLSFVLFIPVLLSEEPLQRDMLEVFDTPECVESILLVLSPKIFLELPACESEALRHRPQHLDHLGQLVIRFAVVLALSRFIQEVPREKFENHACEGPDVS